jgi:flavodoxin/Pyruvate/2-oxoacid:ferredoxin oxidoreductase delta subunit
LRTEIYYFSGTGNSLVVARDIAEKTGGSLIPIASVMKQDAVETDADKVGIVFPVYYGDLPPIVKSFAEKLKGIQTKYIFAVCTFGGGSGESIKNLRHIIRSKGGAVAVAYGVHMPQNAFHKPWEKPVVIFRQWEKKLGRIVDNTAAGAKGNFYFNILLKPLMFLMHIAFKPVYKKSLAKYSDSSPDLELDALIHLVDKSYVVNDKCNACGTCTKVCPVSNIVMTDNKPVWQHHCENCLACYDWCPQKAIQGGVAKGYYYFHPEVKVSDIMKQRGNIAST